MVLDGLFHANILMQKYTLYSVNCIMIQWIYYINDISSDDDIVQIFLSLRTSPKQS